MDKNDTTPSAFKSVYSIDQILGRNMDKNSKGCPTDVLHPRLGLPFLHTEPFWSPQNMHPAMLFGLNYPWQNNLSATTSLINTSSSPNSSAASTPESIDRDER